jgi:hypothetical protein
MRTGIHLMLLVGLLSGCSRSTQPPKAEDSSRPNGAVEIPPGLTVMAEAITSQARNEGPPLAPPPHEKIQPWWRNPPLPPVEKYFHAGELAKGEVALLLEFEKHPDNDLVRFGLGLLQFGRAVERLGQALYEYGADSSRTNVPFLRIPVPRNPNPSTISYRAFGRILDVFVADLERAERTLAGVKSAYVKLPLRLANIHLDLTGGGKPTDNFLDLIIKLNGGRFDFLQKNPAFLVCFDRGDVAWLRSYCHLLSAVVELYRALDLEAEFDQRVRDVFPKVEPSRKGNGDFNLLTFKLVIVDAPRLGRVRLHMLAVCELNRETWKFIRAETDDDHEWLPNPKQTAVIGLPVNDAMIDNWLEMMDNLEGMLKGERLFHDPLLDQFVPNAEGKGLNVKKLLDDPPQVLSLQKLMSTGIDPKYLEDKTGRKTVDSQSFQRAFEMFNGLFNYMAWFN